MKSSKQKKAISKGKSPTSSNRPRSLMPWAIAGVAVAGLAGLIVWKNQSQSTGSAVQASSPEPTVSTNAMMKSAQAKGDFQKLKGRWLRPDGGYVLEIKSAEDQGKLNAAYFNPKPINVAKAEASQEGAATKVFVELRDVNYPGSTYTLTYVADRDLLVGIYYQALQQQSFEVYFERMQ
ncbi:MAG: hypothetical protein U1F83_17505 [Verrucomicrobiota bacterium]